MIAGRLFAQRVALAFGDRRLGWLTFVLVALNPFLLIMTGLVLTDLLSAALVAISAALLLPIPGSTPRRIIVEGMVSLAVLCFGVEVRPANAILLPVGALLWTIRWWQAVRFALPPSARDARGTPVYNRAIVALDVDGEGNIYAASTLDPEGLADDPDNGPFRSVVHRIGRVGGGRPVLDAKPEVLAVLDGVKVESLAVRERDGRRELFIGTDDENYGGILRPLPASAGRR